MNYEIEEIDKRIQEIDVCLEMFQEHPRLVELEKLVEANTKKVRALTIMKKTRTSLIIEVLRNRIDVEFWEQCRNGLRTAKCSAYSLDVSMKLIDELISRGYCICGKSLDEDEACKKELYRLRELVSPINANHIIAGLYNECKLHNASIEEISEKYSSLAKDLVRIGDEISNIQYELSEAEKMVIGSPLSEEVTRLKQKRNELISMKNEIIIKIAKEERLAEIYARRAGKDNDE